MKPQEYKLMPHFWDRISQKRPKCDWNESTQNTLLVLRSNKNTSDVSELDFRNPSRAELDIH